jgi:hypothetical protein
MMSKPIFFTLDNCEHGRWEPDGHWVGCAHIYGSQHLNCPEGPTPWCPGGRVLSDTEALRALLFDVCGECGGEGEVTCDCYAPPLDHPQSCPACGGSGRTPKEGVERLSRVLAFDGTRGAISFPLWMLEGDETNEPDLLPELPYERGKR